jgi:caa(3)-type oxidase subunit IV
MSDHAHAPEAPAHDDHGPAHYVEFLGLRMKKEYLMVLIVLSVLTIAEVGITFTGIDRKIMGVLLVGMAVTKACFVGLYYMHLKYEKKLLLWVAFTPLPLSAVYAAALMLDAEKVLRGLTLPWNLLK